MTGCYTAIMIRSAITLAAILLAFGSLGAQTPALPTIDQVLDKYVESVGGRAALEKVTSLSGRGTILIEGPNITGTIELFQKPDKSLQVVDLAGIGLTREGFDGTVGWTEDPQNGIQLKSGVELADAKRGAVMPRELKMKQLYPKLTVTGREPVDGRPAIVVDAVPAEGTPARFYFDEASGAFVRQVGNRMTPQGPIEVDTIYGDLRAVDGVKRPFLIRQRTPIFIAVLTFTEIKQNVPVDDAMFKKPGGQ